MTAKCHAQSHELPCLIHAYRRVFPAAEEVLETFLNLYCTCTRRTVIDRIMEISSEKAISLNRGRDRDVTRFPWYL